MRLKTKRSRDKRFFKRTAIKSKKININPIIFRGGIRM